MISIYRFVLTGKQNCSVSCVQHFVFCTDGLKVSVQFYCVLKRYSFRQSLQHKETSVAAIWYLHITTLFHQNQSVLKLGMNTGEKFILIKCSVNMCSVVQLISQDWLQMRS